MSTFRSILISAGALLIFVLSLLTDLRQQLAIALAVLVLIGTVDKLGRGIVLREIVALHTSIVCVLMPVIGYRVYNREDQLANLLRRYMRVPEDVYFGYALPAVALFVAAICWPVKSRGQLLDEGEKLGDTLQRIRTTLAKYSDKGFYLVGVGALISLSLGFFPSGLQFFMSLFFFAAFAGVLYIHFAPRFRGKWIVLLLFLAFLIARSLSSGMFTVVAYMGITLFSFFYVGRRHPLPVKLAVLVGGVMLLIVVQNTKGVYRTYIWNKEYAGDRSSLFASIFIDKIQKGSALFDERAFFPVHLRANQGFNVSLVMKRIPELKPHDKGSALSLSLASAVVPRVLWPDKPEAGGKFNMYYYAGWRLRNLSTNIGPLGEAYGAFGVTGGIIFMFVLGLFIRWVYARVFHIGEWLPLIICWLPVLFYQTTYSAETDTLQILNSIFKTAFFIWLLYKLIPSWFGGPVRRQPTASAPAARPTAQPAPTP